MHHARVALLMLSALSMVAATSTTAPATQPTTSPQLLTKLATMPKALYPSPDEQPVRQTARERWVSANVLKMPCLMTGKVVKVDVINVADEEALSKLRAASANTPTKEATEVTLGCGSADVWGRQTAITVTAQLNDTTPTAAASWTAGDMLGVSGHIATLTYDPTTTPATITILIAPAKLAPKKP